MEEKISSIEEKPVKGEWNQKLEESAQCIGHAAQGYKHMHINQANDASEMYMYLMGLGIIVGPLASVLQSIGLALSMETEPIISVFVIVLGFLSGIIVTTVKVGKYEEVINANKSAAARYTSIEANVRRQLGLYRGDRMPAIAYMDWLETKYKELWMSAPLLSDDTVTKYSKEAKVKGLPIPDQYDHLIKINNLYESKKMKEISNNDEIHIKMKDNNNCNGIKRSNNCMAKIHEINFASDKILSYELNRLMGLR